MDRLLAQCGCLYGLRYGPEELESLQRSHKIDKMIQKDKQVIRRQVKLLLLGAGESGKSTFLKADAHHPQLQLRARTACGVPLGRISERASGNEGAGRRPTEAGHTVAEPGQRAGTRLRCGPCGRTPVSGKHSNVRIEFQLGDGVRYFFDHLDRIATKEFIPTNQDILHARKATKSITEFVVPVNGVPFRFVDVGGQRSQRQKWFRCFDSVTSILFLVSSSEFDQALLEDRTTNRLVESRSIFETIVNNRCFAEVSIILFFNKTDLLREKLASRATSIADYIDGFKGDPHNLADVQRFLVNWFYEARRSQHKPLFHHFTTAVDTENIKVVFNAVRDTILQKNITQLMLQ
ncbi:hypothetical protein MRX96_039370 [Rhipicephalus microplus]